MTNNNEIVSDMGFDALIKKHIEECVKKEVDNWLFNIMSKIAEEKAMENNKTLTAKELCQRCRPHPQHPPGAHRCGGYLDRLRR